MIKFFNADFTGENSKVGNKLIKVMFLTDEYHGKGHKIFCILQSEI